MKERVNSTEVDSVTGKDKYKEKRKSLNKKII